MGLTAAVGRLAGAIVYRLGTGEGLFDFGIGCRRCRRKPPVIEPALIVRNERKTCICHETYLSNMRSF